MGLFGTLSRANEIQETIANRGKFANFIYFYTCFCIIFGIYIAFQTLKMFTNYSTSILQGFDYREVFRKIDDDFRMIMKDLLKDTRVVSILRIGSVRSILNTMLDRLERCQKSLNEFLEEKRSSFPR